ncbi:MAG TPA: RES family NAD+ phosphorylase [Acetobacteraceae bacterium]|nr:RES family NAD+ phosphorylase [Acetobacteraceae bacterium]
MSEARLARVGWPKSHRIIRTLYPPVWLFEDIADPADWELLASAEAKTNPRVRQEIGDLSLVPPRRRVSGPTASLVMAAFTHVSRLRPSRFSDGSYGVWYCGDRFAVALAETAYHFERFMRATAEPPAEAQFRELVCAVGGDLRDLTKGAEPASLDPDDWRPGQALGAAARAEGEDGILYPSVRHPEGLAAALFWPNSVKLPVQQARHMLYRWDGARMSRYFVYGENAWHQGPGSSHSGRPFIQGP